MGVFFVVKLMLAVFGAVHIISCTIMGCGMLIWYTCQITFLLQPIVVSLAILIGLPVLYYEVYMDNVTLDRELHDQDDGAAMSFRESETVCCSQLLSVGQRKREIKRTPR